MHVSSLVDLVLVIIYGGVGIVNSYTIFFREDEEIKMSSVIKNCPCCGGTLKCYDRVRRIVRRKNGLKKWVRIRRLICNECCSIHRELPTYLAPYRHYDIRIIEGFLSGMLSSFDLDYEDYPCDSTIANWRKAREKQLL